MVILKRVMLDDVPSELNKYPGSILLDLEKSGFFIIEIPVVKGRYEDE